MKKDKFKKSNYKGNFYSNYGIEIYVGEPRSGKTLVMVAETYEQVKDYPFEVKIYSNINLNKKYFPNYELITYKDLIEYHKKKGSFTNAIFLIDELHIFADARQFMKKGNQAFGYFMGQMGKRGNTFRGNTHFMTLIDYRIRSYTDKITYITKGILERRTWYPILKNTRILTDQENLQLCIKAEPVIRKLMNYDFQYGKDVTSYWMAKKYFDLYDTEELVTIDVEDGN